MPDARLPEGIEGTCDERFAQIPQILARQLASGEHHGAAIAVRHRDAAVVDIWGGTRHGPGGEQPWVQDTMAVSFSTTKGVAATALHMAAERNGIHYDTPVAELWPEFTTAGGETKAKVTVRHVLCHEAGIPQIRGEVPDVYALADWDGMIEVMERLVPLWEPGEQNGYHAITFGFLVGELVRRIDGRDLGAFVAEEIAGPLGLDGMFIGTPVAEQHRIAPLVQPDAPEGSRLQDMIPPDSLTAKALSPDGNIVEFLNTPEGMGCCAPAVSGAFTARSLAAMYAALERGGTLEGTRLLSRQTVETASAVQNTRPDLVLIVPIHWRLGFMGGGSAVSPAGPNREAFGHAGFGGSVALADPKAEISMALVCDQLDLNLLGSDRILSVLNAAIEAAAA